MIVVDASAVVDLLAETQRADAVRWHLAREHRALAPDLIHSEVLSALWRMVRADQLSFGRASAAVGALRAMALTSVPLGPLCLNAWRFRESTRISDAFYLACAQALSLPLLTTDARLARGHHSVPVTLVT